MMMLFELPMRETARMPGYVECFVKCVAMLSYATMSIYVEMEENGRYERKIKGYVEIDICKYMASRDLVMYLFGSLMSIGIVNPIRLVTVYQGFT